MICCIALCLGRGLLFCVSSIDLLHMDNDGIVHSSKDDPTISLGSVVYPHKVQASSLGYAVRDSSKGAKQGDLMHVFVIVS